MSTVSVVDGAGLVSVLRGCVGGFSHAGQGVGFTLCVFVPGSFYDAVVEAVSVWWLVGVV